MFRRGSVGLTEPAFRAASGGASSIDVDQAFQLISQLRGSAAPPRSRIALLLPDFDNNGDGRITLDELRRLDAYLDRGHNVQSELARLYALVESQQSQLRSLHDRALPPSPTPPPATSNGEGLRVPSSTGVPDWMASAVAAAVAGAGSTDAGPRGADGLRGFTVSGAGTKEANGFYAREGEFEGAALFTKGQWWLLRYTLPSGNQWWYIADKYQLDRDDGDLYRVKSNSDLPPLDGWVKAQDGRLPVPQLSAVDDGGMLPSWSFSTWLRSLSLEELFASALLAPLEAAIGMPPSSATQLSFARALGDAVGGGSSEGMRRLLMESSLIDDLAAQM